MRAFVISDSPSAGPGLKTAEELAPYAVYHVPPRSADRRMLICFRHTLADHYGLATR